MQADRFRSYSEYCNNHPDAAAQMAVLQGDMQYRFFFEVRDMICIFLFSVLCLTMSLYTGLSITAENG